MFTWLNNNLLPKASPFIEKHGKEKVLTWGAVISGLFALAAISETGFMSSMLFSTATLYLAASHPKGKSLHAALHKKSLLPEAKHSGGWIACFAFLAGIIFFPSTPSVSTAPVLSAQEKRNTEDYSHFAKQHCHAAVKLALLDHESSVSFPYTVRQLSNQVYVSNMKGDVENMFGGKTRKEWDCQIQFEGGKARIYDNWDIQVIEERNL